MIAVIDKNLLFHFMTIKPYLSSLENVFKDPFQIRHASGWSKIHWPLICKCICLTNINLSGFLILCGNTFINLDNKLLTNVTASCIKQKGKDKEECTQKICSTN